MLAVAKAREDFKAGINARLAVLDQATNALKEGKLELNCCQSRARSSQLVGSLGSFFALGSRLAQEIEQMLHTKNFLCSISTPL